MPDQDSGHESADQLVTAPMKPRDGDSEDAGGATWLARLRRSFREPRLNRGQILAAVLCGLLAFAAVVQIRARDAGSQLAGARESDLVVILDGVTGQAQRLEDEQRDLQNAKERLEFGADREQAALEQATQRATTLGILAGTLAAKGPGVQLTIQDPARKVDADTLLNALQELRDAGAEAIQLNGVRLVASSDLLDVASSAILVDGTRIQPPYTFLVIGDPDTIATALDIPGGVLDVLAERDATGEVSKRPDVRVDAVRALDPMPHSRASRAERGQ
jgi:uncharacterized protein YlxW (UPF0749 family)